MISVLDSVGNPSFRYSPVSIVYPTATQSFQIGNSTTTGSGPVFIRPLNTDGTLSNRFSVGTGDFTLEMFMSLAGNQPSNAGIFGFPENTTTAYGFGVYLLSNTFNLDIRNAVGADISSTAITFEPNVWFHVALVRNSGTVYFYYNGNRYSPRSGQSSFNSYNINGNSVVIGCRFGASEESSVDLRNFVFNGYIGQVRYSKKAVYTSTTFTVPTSRLGLTQGSSGGIAALASGDVLLLMNACTPAYSYNSKNINFIDTVSFRSSGGRFVYDISYLNVKNTSAGGTTMVYPTLYNSAPTGFSDQIITPPIIHHSAPHFFPKKMNILFYLVSLVKI